MVAEFFGHREDRDRYLAREKADRASAIAQRLESGSATSEAFLYPTDTGSLTSIVDKGLEEEVRTGPVALGSLPFSLGVPVIVDLVETRGVPPGRALKEVVQGLRRRNIEVSAEDRQRLYSYVKY